MKYWNEKNNIEILRKMELSAVQYLSWLLNQIWGKIIEFIVQNKGYGPPQLTITYKHGVMIFSEIAQ